MIENGFKETYGTKDLSVMIAKMEESNFKINLNFKIKYNSSPSTYLTTFMFIKYKTTNLNYKMSIILILLRDISILK